MKRIIFSLILVLSIGLIFAVNGNATIINSPSPFAGFDSDDGTISFMPNDLVFNIEQTDLGSSGPVSFGFYFDNDSSSLIEIFDNLDEYGTAVVNFTAGVVWDVEEVALQDTFTVSTDNIGFYITIAGNTVYTDPLLNFGELDLAATFPSLFDPSSYLIGYELPNEVILAYEVVHGITPIVNPEPATMLLLGSGLVGLFGFRKKFMI